MTCESALSPEIIKDTVFRFVYARAHFSGNRPIQPIQPHIRTRLPQLLVGPLARVNSGP